MSIFKHRHKWEFDNLSRWLLFFGVATPKDLYRNEAYRKCKKCGEKRPLMPGIPL